MIRVLIAEDQTLVRGALRALLELEDDLTVVAEVGRGDEVVTVELRTDDERVTLTVSDDGRGGAGTAGAGLSGLTERVAALGGRLEAGPAADRGFRLAARLPKTPATAEPVAGR